MINQTESAGNVVSLADERVKRLFVNATPEQWLKWAVVCEVATVEHIGEALRMNLTIDDMFRSLAETMYPDEGEGDLQ